LKRDGRAMNAHGERGSTGKKKGKVHSKGQSRTEAFGREKRKVKTYKGGARGHATPGAGGESRGPQTDKSHGGKRKKTRTGPNPIGNNNDE